MKFNKLGTLAVSISLVLATQAGAQQILFPDDASISSLVPEGATKAPVYDVSGDVTLWSRGGPYDIPSSGEHYNPSTENTVKANFSFARLNAKLCGQSDYSPAFQMGGIAVPNRQGKTDLFFYGNSPQEQNCYTFSRKGAPLYETGSIYVPTIHFDGIQSLNDKQDNYNVGQFNNSQVTTVQGQTGSAFFSTPADVEGKVISIDRQNYTATLKVSSCQFFGGMSPEEASKLFTAVVIPQSQLVLNRLTIFSHAYEVRVIEKSGVCLRSGISTRIGLPNPVLEVTVPLFAPSLPTDNKLYHVSNENIIDQNARIEVIVN